MRILVVSNSFHVGTGYGAQTRLIFKGLQELGHTVANVSYYGIQGSRLTVDGVTVYPSFRETWCGDVVAAHAAHFGADLVMNFHDIWVLPSDYREKFKPWPWATYFPVDSTPPAPHTVTMASKADYPIVYSKFGLQQMDEAGVPCRYIPHSFDSSVFKPGDRDAARDFWGLPRDAYVFAMVAANKGFPSRKAFPEQLSAFAELRKKHKDAILLLHTARYPVDLPNNGIYFDPLIARLGLEGAVYFTNEYLQCVGAEPEHVARVYQAADCLLNCSYAEGFGLAILEAHACGTPVLATNFSSMPELIVSGALAESIQPYWSLLGCWQAIPAICDIAYLMEDAYNGRFPRLTDEQLARLRGEYEYQSVTAKYWAPFLLTVPHARAAGA